MLTKQSPRQDNVSVDVTIKLYKIHITNTIPDRVQKLKAAKADATKEIEAYKAKKEADLKQFEAEVSVVSISIF